MVQAGKPTDLVIESLIPLLQKDDVIIDGGNAKWTDTIRRERKLSDHGIHFVGSGVSGGEEGSLRSIPHAWWFNRCMESNQGYLVIHIR